jgi:hypothetical protein
VRTQAKWLGARVNIVKAEGTKMTTFDRYIDVDAQVAQVCESCGRARESVRLIAVSKTVGPEDVELALRAGAADFGENRPEQLSLKQPLFEQATWHFIGNIQSRRIPEIVEHAALIHSVFKVEHAQKIGKAALAIGKVQDILLEVNVSGEQSKSGFTPAEACAAVLECAALPGVRVRGLMTMAPQGVGAGASDTFGGLKQVFDSCKAALDPALAKDFTELSMGMSEDWPLAIAKGATMVRIGRAIFSESFDEQ